MRILVIDDDKSLRDFLRSTLESESFVVDTAEDGIRGSYLARTNDYDLIVLDHVMPGKNGAQVCAEIRTSGKTTPILTLSVRTEIEDKVAHFDSGADDYLTKPYSHKELMARIRSLLRRSHGARTGMLSAEKLRMDTDTQEVTVGKRAIYLTRKEFALLELLLRNKGKVVSRGMIMEHVWDMEGNPFSKTIETHIVNLRRKLQSAGKRIILNVPGRGYKIAQ